MQTDDLVNLLAKDARVRMRFSQVFRIALAIAVVVSAVLLLSTLGIRKNMAEAIETPRVMFKIGLTLLLAVTSTRLAFRIGQPGASLHSAGLALFLPLILLLLGVVAELFVLPPAAWGASLKGHYSSFCLFFVPALSIADRKSVV